MIRGQKLALAGTCLLFVSTPLFAAPAQLPQKDYLSQSEAEKVRDADTLNERIHLFIQFADTRMKQLQYELQHPANSLHPEERINNLMIGYSNCLDDASDLIDEGLDKQQDIRKGIKEMESRAPDFLQYFKGLQVQGAKMDPYKDNLDDAVESTTDAIDTAQDAEKQLAPPPVRRKPA